MGIGNTGRRGHRGSVKDLWAEKLPALLKSLTCGWTEVYLRELTDSNSFYLVI